MEESICFWTCNGVHELYEYGEKKLFWFKQFFITIIIWMVSHTHFICQSDGYCPLSSLYSLSKQFPLRQIVMAYHFTHMVSQNYFPSEVRQWWSTIPIVWYLQTIYPRSQTVLINHLPWIVYCNHFSQKSDSGHPLFLVYGFCRPYTPDPRQSRLTIYLGQFIATISLRSQTVVVHYSFSMVSTDHFLLSWDSIEPPYPPEYFSTPSQRASWCLFTIVCNGDYPPYSLRWYLATIFTTCCKNGYITVAVGMKQLNYLLPALYLFTTWTGSSMSGWVVWNTVYLTLVMGYCTGHSEMVTMNHLTGCEHLS
jgi:hypothetical protein